MLLLLTSFPSDPSPITAGIFYTSKFRYRSCSLYLFAHCDVDFPALLSIFLFSVLLFEFESQETAQWVRAGLLSVFAYFVYEAKRVFYFAYFNL